MQDDRDRVAGEGRSDVIRGLRPTDHRYCSKVRTPITPESGRIMRPFLPSLVGKTSPCSPHPRCKRHSTFLVGQSRGAERSACLERNKPMLAWSALTCDTSHKTKRQQGERRCRLVRRNLSP